MSSSVELEKSQTQLPRSYATPASSREDLRRPNSCGAPAVLASCYVRKNAHENVWATIPEPVVGVSIDGGMQVTQPDAR